MKPIPGGIPMLLRAGELLQHLLDSSQPFSAQEIIPEGASPAVLVAKGKAKEMFKAVKNRWERVFREL